VGPPEEQAGRLDTQVMVVQVVKIVITEAPVAAVVGVVGELLLETL
jgi:hypothetical protein